LLSVQTPLSSTDHQPTALSVSDPLFRTDPWKWWRANMPIAKKWAYLDHAAIGPLSAPAADALVQYATEARDEGDTLWPQWSKQVGALRSAAAEMITADANEICLVPNTSAGINLVAEGFPWQPGDNVVVPEGEFPSNLYPWLNQASRGVDVRVVPRQDGRVCPDDLFRRVDASTRMIALSWVGYASGFRVDVETIVERAHQAGVLVFLDAIQGLGVYDLDLSRIKVDFLAADGHKWLLGPEGMGIAFIRHQHLSTLRCGSVGWNSVRNAFNYTEPKLELRDTAARFEPGSANMPGATALNASLRLMLAIKQSHGRDVIAKRVLTLAGELSDKLAEAGAKTRWPDEPSRRSSIVTFELDGVEPSEIRNRALENRCVVSCRDGGVRASVHAYNDASDLDRLVETVRSFSGSV
jgi:selenocysteine lyase/cysteine desulfurase